MLLSLPLRQFRIPLEIRSFYSCTGTRNQTVCRLSKDFATAIPSASGVVRPEILATLRQLLWMEYCPPAPIYTRNCIGYRQSVKFKCIN